VQAFRGYLRLLVADSDRVGTALRVILTQSAYDRPELASLVFQRRVSFTLGLIAVHCHLLLFGLGVSQVDASGLIQSFDGMRRQLHALVPAPSPLAA
jgi:cytolysin (calcineurin-like family phosphatase)